MNNELVLYDFGFIFPYDVSSLRDKVDELAIVCKLVGNNVQFIGPSKVDINYFSACMYFHHGISNRSYININFRIVDRKNIVEEVAIRVNPKVYLDGDYHYKGLDKLLIEENIDHLINYL